MYFCVFFSIETQLQTSFDRCSRFSRPLFVFFFPFFCYFSFFFVTSIFYEKFDNTLFFHFLNSFLRVRTRYFVCIHSSNVLREDLSRFSRFSSRFLFSGTLCFVFLFVFRSFFYPLFLYIFFRSVVFISSLM